MCLLRKITYGEFSESIREKKITYNLLGSFGFTENYVMLRDPWGSKPYEDIYAKI